jgi:primosomal protein N' (replication factor Y)
VAQQLVAVALPLPVPAPFTYRIEDRVPAPGVRVLVPFGQRRVIGVVTGPASRRRRTSG